MSMNQKTATCVPPPSAEFLARYNELRKPTNINYKKVVIYQPPQSFQEHPLWHKVLNHAKLDEEFYNRLEDDKTFHDIAFHRLVFKWTPTSVDEELARQTIDLAIINRLELVKSQKVLLRMYYGELDDGQKKERKEKMQAELGYTRGQMMQDMPAFDRLELELMHTFDMDVSSDDPIDWDKLGVEY